MGRMFDATAAALEHESWEWLETQHPQLAEALIRDVGLGATPEAMRRFVLSYAGSERDLLAKRLELAVRYLKREDS